MHTASIARLEQLLARKGTIDARVAESPELAGRLRDLRAWQAGRLAKTYEDLHREPRYRAAVDFFLKDLYGPEVIARRDRGLRRVWRYFKRALPAAALKVLEHAMMLDVLSAELDEAMAEQLRAGALTGAAYGAAYRRVDRARDRRRQIELLVAIGEDLDRIVRHPWIGLALRAAHIPARAAGLGDLQAFLERGFAAFRRMQGAQGLLRTIREREMHLLEALFGGGNPQFGMRGVASAHLP